MQDVGIEDLYKDAYDAMVRLAHGVTGSLSVAEDIVQDSFVRLHAHWDALDNPGGYLRVIVVNASRSWHRTQLRERARLQRIATTIVTIERPRELDDALDALPAQLRRALLLRYYEHLSPTEIATLLSIPRNTVKSDLRRALIALRHTVRR